MLVPEADQASQYGPPVASVQREKTILLVVSALLILTSFAVYRPDRSLPFDFVDFSEFLPLLQGENSFPGRVGDLSRYYADQGRFNPMVYASLAAKWDLWGSYTPAWQWARFATMWAIVWLSFRLLRRLGVSALGAMAGASVFLFSPPAVDGFSRLTMAEPIGTVCLLAMCHLALRQRSAATFGNTGVIFGILAVFLVLLKEMMAATLILPLALIAGASDLPSGDGRTRARILTISASIAVFIAGMPVLLTMMRASGDAYTTSFGQDMRSPGDLIANWMMGILPIGLGTAVPSTLLGAVLVFVLGLFVGGWVRRLRRSFDVTQRRLLAVALAFPLIGALTYLPWPTYNRFYSIPYLMGGAILAGVAMTELVSGSRLVRNVALIGWCLLLALGAADAASQAKRQAVRQVFNAELVARVADLWSPTDTVLLAADLPAPAAWQSLGPTLRRHGEALGHDMPELVTTPCEVSRASARNGVGALFYHSLCPVAPLGRHYSLPYRVFRVQSFGMVEDSIRVDFAVPAARRATSGSAGY